MTHEESSEAQAEAVERMWLSNHVAVGGGSEGLQACLCGLAAHV